jgi:hypothetical protein
VGLSDARFPPSIHGLIGAVVGAASRLGFHGKAKVTKEGARYIITLRVQHVDDVIDELSERERKRRARAERG